MTMETGNASINISANKSAKKGSRSSSLQGKHYKEMDIHNLRVFSRKKSMKPFFLKNILYFFAIIDVFTNRFPIRFRNIIIFLRIYYYIIIYFFILQISVKYNLYFERYDK